MKSPEFAYVYRSEDGNDRESIGSFPAFAVPRVGELVVTDGGEVRVVTKVAWFVPNGRTDCIAFVDVSLIPDDEIVEQDKPMPPELPPSGGAG